MRELLLPGQNCWKVVHADRASFLIDGAAYFEALYKAMQQAQKSIIIVGWDVHSELRLIRHDDSDESPRTLGKFLNYLVSRRKELQVYLLCWDFAMIYAIEREFFPRYKLKWQTHKRIHFILDSEHPTGASQHQKVAVIDDTIAFSGGLDISKWRWDTPNHLISDKQRIDPDGERYPPFHDVQLVVDGQAAAALGQLVRQRWQRASGEYPVEVDQISGNTPWPEGVAPDFENISMAIARTLPEYKQYDEVREVEHLYVDSIAFARSHIYIENQYFSSHRIGEALKARLAEEDGPEVIVVLPLKTGGWLEQHTMDILRDRMLHMLREADTHNRLRIYYPRLSVDPEITLMVHAKVMVIDDCFVRVGSSNLSNRSLGLDSECDLMIADDQQDSCSPRIASFRNRLLAEHLGVSEADVRQAISVCGSIIDAIDSLRGAERTLVTLKETDAGAKAFESMAKSELLDPEKPIEPEEFMNYLVHPEQRSSNYHQLIKIILLIALVFGLGSLWRWTPFGDWLDIESIITAVEWIRSHPLTPLIIPVGYIVLGLISFPITLLVMATVMVLGPWWGVAYALVGTVLSAAMMFGVGHILGRKFVNQFCGSLINRLDRQLSETGLIAVITLRIIPVAPFSVINLIAGISSISLKDFCLGTLIGSLPGIIAITLVANRLSDSLRQPDLFSFMLLLAAVALVGAALLGLRWWIRKKTSIPQ